MSLNGSSALARVAQNPDCQRLVAMAVSGISEPELYRKVTGTPYPREFGERLSARRRGTKFEQNILGNNAAKLRRATASLVGVDPELMFVRNLADEAVGPRAVAFARRARRTRQIIEDAVAGRSLAHILVHPVFRLTVPGSRDGGFWIEPDFAAWDPRLSMYLPGDLKSFVVVENGVDPSDLARVRLQLAAQHLGLRELAGTLSVAQRVTAKGLLVFATPYGLEPHAPREEDLRGAVAAVNRAISAFGTHRLALDATRAAMGSTPEAAIPRLQSNFEERCVSTCVFADVCRAGHRGTARELGDTASQLLGSDRSLDRLVALLEGAAPADDAEREIRMQLLEASALFVPVPRAA